MAEPTPPPSLTCGARENSLSVNGTSKNKESKTNLLTPTITIGSSQIRDQVYASFPLTPKTTKQDYQTSRKTFRTYFEPHRYSRRNIACRLPARRGGSLTSRWTSDWTLELRGAVIALNSVPNPIRKRIMFGGKGLNRHVVQLGHICNVCQLRLRLPKRTRAHDTESNAGFEPLDVAEEAMERH